jgi:hypothetical protein
MCHIFCAINFYAERVDKDIQMALTEFQCGSVLKENISIMVLKKNYSLLSPTLSGVWWQTCIRKVLYTYQKNNFGR